MVKTLLIRIGCFFGLLVFCTLVYQYHLVNWSVPFEPLSSSDVRQAATAVFKKFHWRHLDNDFWEREIDVQLRELGGHPSSERVMFFVEIIKHCDVEGGASLLLLDALAPDRREVQSALKCLVKSPRFVGFPAEVRDRVISMSNLLEAEIQNKGSGGAAARLSAELSAQVESGSRTRATAPALKAASGYFEHNVKRMNYAVYRAMGFPIGSGVTEAACKTLVKLRLGGSGMKWIREGAQTVLTLRALLLSDSRWTSLWDYVNKHGLTEC